ncbi:MAG: uracil-DNA glycosylase family protein [Sneathiellaceae bacterium]
MAAPEDWLDLDAPAPLRAVLEEIGRCRICAGCLPHDPRPVLRLHPGARVMICGQAPGRRVHDTGIPFNDPSGDRLRDWLGVDRRVFYDPGRFAILPMGFCFPGQDGRGADLPPRRECAPAWRSRLAPWSADVGLTLLVGQYAQAWYLGRLRRRSMTETVRHWRDYLPAYLPLPHPSWRNTAWLRRHPWFEAEVLPELRRRVGILLEAP